MCLAGFRLTGFRSVIINSGGTVEKETHHLSPLQWGAQWKSPSQPTRVPAPLSSRNLSYPRLRAIGCYPEIRAKLGCLRLLVRCLLFTKLCWVGKYIPGKFYYETDNSPTQGELNPRKNRLKVTFGPLFFPQHFFFFFGFWFLWGGIDFILGSRVQEAQRNQIVRKHPILFVSDCRDCTAQKPAKQERSSEPGLIQVSVATRFVRP